MSHRKRQKKSVREVESRRHYSGEASPYWEFMQNHAPTSSDGQPEENIFANPDLLGEDEHIYHRPLTERGEFQFQVIRNALKDLSPQQQRVLQLHGFEGWTLKEVARELGISPSTVETFLHRARKALKRAYYEALQERKESW